MAQKKKMLIWIFLGIVALIVIGVLLLYRIVFSGTNPVLPKVTIRIGGTTFSVELATTMAEQAKGLSGRESLGEDDGMLFTFSTSSVQNFWMKDMNFPLDMIWIGSTTPTSTGSGHVTAGGQTAKVLGFAQNAEPQPGAPLWALTIYTSPNGVDTVLEVPAGTVARDGITVGEPVEITR